MAGGVLGATQVGQGKAPGSTGERAQAKGRYKTGGGRPSRAPAASGLNCNQAGLGQYKATSHTQTLWVKSHQRPLHTTVTTVSGTEETEKKYHSKD